MGQNTLTNDQQSSWRSFLLAHDRLVQLLDAELGENNELTLAEFEVLSHLSESADNRLRMNELATLARLSPSGLTRRFDSLVDRGLVDRERCDDDRRGVMAILTKEGAKRLKTAAPTHNRIVNEKFLEPLSANEAKSITKISAKIVAATDESED